MTPLLAQRPRVDRAFERLYRKHVHAVYRYALAVLHNQADAEDVTQITFLSAYRAFCRGERPERAHNWLIKIAHNVCRQRFREAARRPQEVALVSDDVFPAPEPDGDVPTAEEIRRALGFLSFNQRAALVMRELEGRSYAEIGEVLSLSMSAVETLLFRARRALREQLTGGLTCEQAEVTLAQLQERRLTSDERGALRAHLRECKDCAALERRHRAQRGAVKGLATIPLPGSLSSFFGSGAVGGGAAVGGTGLAAKAAAVVAAGLVSAGVTHEVLQTAGAAEKGKSRSPTSAAATNPSFSAVSSVTGGRATPTSLAPGKAGRGLSAVASAGRGAPVPGSTARHRRGERDSGEEAGGGSSSSHQQPTEPVAAATQTVTETVNQTLPVRLPPPPPIPPVPIPPVPPLPPPPPIPPVPPLPPPPPLPPLPPPPPLPPVPPPPR